MTVPARAGRSEVEVLEALAEREGTFTLHFDHFDWGGEYYKKHGRMMPETGES